MSYLLLLLSGHASNNPLPPLYKKKILHFFLSLKIWYYFLQINNYPLDCILLSS